MFLYGPTAVGKTALAIQLAQRCNGVIINADSMQVYDQLRVITARPSVEEEAAAPHQHFGVVDPSVRYSTKAWLDDVTRLIAQAQGEGRRPILVGGTGLYHSALTGGLSAMLEPSAEILNAIKAMDMDQLRQAIAQEDPASAHLVDRQRLIRALSVTRGSTPDKPFSYWVAQPNVGAVPGVLTFTLDPDRDKLRERINLRFELMVEQGALDEVEGLLARGLDPTLPAMGAIGVPELGGYLSGECDLDHAIERASAHSRQYAKRQLTWARNQMSSAIKLPVTEFKEQETERYLSKIFSFLD